jgi:hypothetical protein
MGPAAGKLVHGASVFGDNLRLHSKGLPYSNCSTIVASVWQFSATSELLLLAYGRRHVSLCSLVSDGSTVMPVHNVLEVYSVQVRGMRRCTRGPEELHLFFVKVH